MNTEGKPSCAGRRLTSFEEVEALVEEGRGVTWWANSHTESAYYPGDERTTEAWHCIRWEARTFHKVLREGLWEFDRSKWRPRATLAKGENDAD